MAKQVTAFLGFAIFADYDANAPDTEDLLLVTDEDAAKRLCDKLNENPRRYGSLAFVDGWEFAKSFQYREAIRLEEADFLSFEDALARAEEDAEDPEDEEEDDN